MSTLKIRKKSRMSTRGHNGDWRDKAKYLTDEVTQINHRQSAGVKYASRKPERNVNWNLVSLLLKQGHNLETAKAHAKALTQMGRGK